MQDEQFMRQWNESHDAFSAGVTRMAGKFDPCRELGSGGDVGLHHAQANRIFIAVITGLVAGVVAASTVAVTDRTPMASAVTTAPALA